MEMNGERDVPVSVETTWAALNDPATLQACIPGCESIERVAENEYRVALTARVGPVSAKFTGRMTVADIVAPTSYTLSFEGQGGAAGFAKGEARVALCAAGRRHAHRLRGQGAGRRQAGADRVAADRRRRAEDRRRFLRAASSSALRRRRAQDRSPP